MDQRQAWKHLTAVTRPGLRLAPPTYLDDIRSNLRANGMPEAVAAHDTAALFDWLVGVSQFQGISDRNAIAFTAKNGLVGWDDIDGALEADPCCPRLQNYWVFSGCGYRKGTGTFAEPRHIRRCSLPTHPTRKGSLIQAAYALFLFIRDVCDGDLIDWIDRHLADADPGPEMPDRAVRMGAALTEPLTHIYGFGQKIWAFALSDLLLAADPNRERWVATGAGIIVVDTLLHNHLHRTGTLRRFHAEHAYEPRCYARNGCADILRGLADRIDACEFNPAFPACFPRFVQFAVWRFCSNVCNGNRIDDRDRCGNALCPAIAHCDRVALHPSGYGENRPDNSAGSGK